MKAIFDGKVFVPLGPVHLPVGSQVMMSATPPLEDETSPTPLMRLLAELERIPVGDDSDIPTDLAAQYKHYLYGTPKQP